MNLLLHAKDIFLDILFPTLCLGCKSTLEDKNSIICVSCKEKIKIQNAFFCAECGGRLYEMKKMCHPGMPLICGAAEIYGTEPVTELVKLLKYSGIKSAAEVLGNLLYKYTSLLKITAEDFVVIPIPLPKRRLRKRGFNQAELIARRFLARAGYEKSFRNNILTRKFTKPQTEMKNYEKRQENVRGCFLVKDKSLVEGKNIMLIDDVYTSGATMKEAARVLKKAGAKKILGLTVLKAHR